MKVVAGSMLALGKAPSAGLHRAGRLPDPDDAGRAPLLGGDGPSRPADAQQIDFFKNLGLLGGLLIAAADTEGKPSLAWRGRKAAKLAAAAAATQVGGPSRVDDVGRGVGRSRVTDGRRCTQTHPARVAGLAAGAAGLLPAAAASTRGSQTDRLKRRAAKKASKAVSRAQRRGAALQGAAEKRAAELQKAVDKQSSRAAGPRCQEERRARRASGEEA